MTTDAAELLRSWQQRLRVITRNVNELSEAELTKRVRNRLRSNQYVGLTQQKAEQVAASLSALSDDYLLLARVLEAAEAAHRGGLLPGSRETRDARVAALLEGASIDRPAVRVPLLERGLLDPADARTPLTPAALLAAMESAFASACDALAEIAQAEEQGGGELDALRADYARMERRAVELQDEDRPSLVAVEALRSDPVRALEGIAALRRGLESWGVQLSKLESLRAEAQAGLAQARTVIADLQRVSDDRAQRTAEVEQRLGADVLRALPEPLSLRTLTSWLQAIEHSANHHEWRAASVGLGRLLPVLNAMLAEEHRKMALVQAPLAEIKDLEGLFSALRAKARQVARQNGAANALQEARAAVETALGAQPIRIQELKTLLARYQRLLVAGEGAPARE
jgi:hypothetical protein